MAGWKAAVTDKRTNESSKNDVMLIIVFTRPDWLTPSHSQPVQRATLPPGLQLSLGPTSAPVPLRRTLFRAIAESQSPNPPSQSIIIPFLPWPTHGLPPRHHREQICASHAGRLPYTTPASRPCPRRSVLEVSVRTSARASSGLRVRSRPSAHVPLLNHHERVVSLSSATQLASEHRR